MLQRPCAGLVAPQRPLVAAVHQLDVVLNLHARQPLAHAEEVARDAAVRPVVPVLVSLAARAVEHENGQPHVFL